jgi:phage antirepressor YoqD-like protein
MNNLEVFNTITMSSREIAELTGKDHGNVMRDIRTVQEALSTDSNLNPCIKTTTYVGKDGREYSQYELDKDTTLCLVAGYDVVVRMRIIKRWQELEQAATANHPQLPQTYIEALEALLAAEKEKLALQEANAEMKPKAEYFDNLVARNLLVNIRDTAKELRIKQNEFVAFLLDGKYLYRDQKGKLRPYAQHTPTLFEVKEFSRGEFSDVQTLVTPQGRETFRLLLQVPRLEKK